MNLLSNYGSSKKPSTSKENSNSILQLYSRKERSGFENFLNLPNKK